MLRTEEQIKKLAVVTGVMLLATAEALAQDKISPPARRAGSSSVSRTANSPWSRPTAF